MFVTCLGATPVFGEDGKLPGKSDGPGGLLDTVAPSEFAGPEVCRPSATSPSCRARPFKRAANDLTSPRWGLVRPAVAKDVIAGCSAIHSAAYLNDGLYGNGASWVSASDYSWVKIDLGQMATVNEVHLGRDRLGAYNDRPYDRFKVELAQSDGGDQSDGNEYAAVFDNGPKVVSAKGKIDTNLPLGQRTYRVTFDPRQARYVKITFARKGAAIDEIEVFGQVADGVKPTMLALGDAGFPTFDRMQVRFPAAVDATELRLRPEASPKGGMLTVKKGAGVVCNVPVKPGNAWEPVACPIKVEAGAVLEAYLSASGGPATPLDPSFVIFNLRQP